MSHHHHDNEVKEVPKIEHKPEDDIFHYYCKVCKKIVEEKMKSRKRVCKECDSAAIVFASHRSLTNTFRI